jgi:hypothetical protein
MRRIENFFALVLIAVAASSATAAEPVKVGILGCDNYQAHAKRVCSERFSALWEPIGAFGVEINQPFGCAGVYSAVSQTA